MARGRRVKTRYRTRVKKVYSRNKGLFGGMGKLKPLLFGAGAEVGADVLTSKIGPWGGPIAYGFCGWFGNNQTLLTQAGQMIGNLLTGNLGGSGGGMVR